MSVPKGAERPTPADVLQWAVDIFGAIALNRDERAARLVEEAIEVAQVEGVPLEIVQRIATRVYSRPAGELGQEIGGLMVGIYSLAANVGVDHEAEFKREFDRVRSKPKEWWTRKHADKVAAGTADLSPSSEKKPVVPPLKRKGTLIFAVNTSQGQAYARSNKLSPNDFTVVQHESQVMGISPADFDHVCIDGWARNEYVQRAYDIWKDKLRRYAVQQGGG